VTRSAFLSRRVAAGVHPEEAAELADTEPRADWGEVLDRAGRVRDPGAGTGDVCPGEHCEPRPMGWP